jgi:hypothetical protein
MAVCLRTSTIAPVVIEAQVSENEANTKMEWRGSNPVAKSAMDGIHRFLSI